MDTTSPKNRKLTYQIQKNSSTQKLNYLQKLNRFYKNENNAYFQNALFRGSKGPPRKPILLGITPCHVMLGSGYTVFNNKKQFYQQKQTKNCDGGVESTWIFSHLTANMMVSVFDISECMFVHTLYKHTLSVVLSVQTYKQCSPVCANITLSVVLYVQTYTQCSPVCANIHSV